jgi:hypothetical protein
VTERTSAGNETRKARIAARRNTAFLGSLPSIVDDELAVFMMIGRLMRSSGEGS